MIIVFLSSCNFKLKKDKENIIAQVYDSKLLGKDLQGVVPCGVSSQDSINLVHDYINQWVRKQVILNKAINNNFSTPEEEDVLEKKVQEYRNSLLVYRYEKYLVEQRLDTVVSYQEAEDYYNSHKKEFTLKEDIVQVAFVKFNKDSKNIKPVRKLLKEYKPEDVDKIKNIAKDKAVNYLLNDNSWILYSDLIKEVPIVTYNEKLFLKNNKYIEMNDSLYTYMVRINNYKIEDNVSPFSFEYDNIRSLIINIRKMKLIDTMEDDVFREAQEKGAIKIKN